MIASWLTKPLQFLPPPLTATTLGVILNIYFHRYPEMRQRLAEMDGKLFQFQVEDLGQSFFMSVEGQDVRVYNTSDLEPNVVMAGDANAFLALLFQTADPDSLFFSRKLKLSGETDTGLHFKNLLNNVEIDWEKELAEAVSWPVAKLLLSAAGYVKQGWKSSQDRLNQTTDQWLKAESVPRHAELEDLQAELSELTKAVEHLEGSTSRAGKRLAIASRRPSESKDLT